jgi:hypothetical protein
VGCSVEPWTARPEMLRGTQGRDVISRGRFAARNSAGGLSGHDRASCPPK